MTDHPHGTRAYYGANGTATVAISPDGETLYISNDPGDTVWAIGV